MATINRWPEYHAGSLTLPAVVRLEQSPDSTHLAWVMTEHGGLQGPMRMRTWGPEAEAKLLEVANMAGVPDDEFICGDGEVV